MFATIIYIYRRYTEYNEFITSRQDMYIVVKSYFQKAASEVHDFFLIHAVGIYLYMLSFALLIIVLIL